MSSLRSKKAFGLGAALLIMGLDSTSAFAGPVLTITDGFTTVSRSDTDGNVDYIGSIGSWELEVHAGQGHIAESSLALTVGAGNFEGSGVLSIFFSDTDFTGSLGAWIDGAITGDINGIVTLDLCFNANNEDIVDDAACTVVSGSGLLDSEDSWTGGSEIDTSGGAFSMGLKLTIDQTGLDQGNGIGAHLFLSRPIADNEVPEPSILGLFGFGLLGMGVIVRRRKKGLYDRQRNLVPCFNSRQPR